MKSSLYNGFSVIPENNAEQWKLTKANDKRLQVGMKTSGKVSFHEYPQSRSGRNIEVHWYDGWLNGLPFRCPVVTYPDNWVQEEFIFYDQPRINTDTNHSVVFVEDERSADALIRQGQLATTIPANGVAVNSIDWSLFSGKEIIVWPDNYCKPSERIQLVLKHILYANPTSLQVVKYSDWVPESWNAGALEFTSQDGNFNELVGYANENSVDVIEYFELLGDKKEFDFNSYWYPRLPKGNHPDFTFHTN